MNFERLITIDEVEEIEAISTYDLSTQIQDGISQDFIDENLFLAQIDKLIEVTEWYNRSF